MERKIIIGLMGPGEATTSVEAMSETIGKLIAEAGAVLITGGMGGAMAAASRGASKAGGLVIGVLPGSTARDANPYVDIPIVTGMGNARNCVNILTSDAIIAVAGGYGTLSEIALALKCRKPVVKLRSWELETVGCNDPLLHVAVSPEDAVRLALKLAEK